MNSKMTTNSQLSTTEPKANQNKNKNKENNQNRNRITEMEITWKVTNRAVTGERGGKCTENKQHKWQVEDRQGEGKNRIRNVEAKELIYMTHGHELKVGIAGGKGGYWVEGDKGGKLGQQ